MHLEASVGPAVRPAPAELPPPPASRSGWPWTGGPPAPAAEIAWPLISIVIPSLNQAAYLEPALRSVLQQGYPRLELIVMDGGSSDGSIDVLSRYAPWLAHWRSQPDDGPADALNQGFALAHGDILGVLNADDFHLPRALEQVAREFALHPDADVVSGHGYFATPEGELGVAAFSDRWHATRFRHGACILFQPATFFRRAAFERAGRFGTLRTLCWDSELWARLAHAGAVFHDSDAFLAAFRLHAGSITGRADLAARRRREARAVFERLNGHPDTLADRLRHYLHRASKLARHPGRMLRQRLFVHAILKRWSL